MMFHVSMSEAQYDRINLALQHAGFESLSDYEQHVYGREMELSEAAMQDVYNALQKFEEVSPAIEQSRALAESNDSGWEPENIEFLLGCVKTTIEERDFHLLHGWSI